MNMDLKQECAVTSLILSPSIKPCSFILSVKFPSSKRGFILSKIDGLHKLEFSNTTHSPYTMALIRTESTHSNLLPPPDSFYYLSDEVHSKHPKS